MNNSAMRMGLILGMALPAAAFGAEGVVLDVEVKDVKADQGGSLRCAVFGEGGAKGFPSTPEKATDRAVFKAEAAEHRIQLRVPGPGMYAVSCNHDANDNEKMDTNFLGIPKEGWGVSNGARPSMRAPRFDEAKFEVMGSKRSVVVPIGY